MLNGKTILITGGTGSFGSAMIDHLLKTEVQEIRILSRDEAKQEAMRVSLAEPRLRFYIGDVRNPLSLDSAMGGVDLVFHAAAMKQVPTCEFFPIEAVSTNVIGSANTIESAIRHGVSRVVCLGTDKAVYPVNAMGMTKALMEKVAHASARQIESDATRVCSVRYGNVMYSRGSVIPLFVNQIKSGRPITVTEPTMTRFMLPLREAVGLVEYAWSNARQGDIFVRKAPACSVAVLVDALQDIFGSNVPVKRIGMRHGEKLHETLVSAEELRRAEDLGDYYRILMDDRDLNYDKYFTLGDPGEIDIEDYRSDNAEQLDVGQTRELLLTLPEIREAA